MKKPAAITLYWLSALLFSAVTGYRLSLWKVTGMAGSDWGATTAVIFLWPLFAAVVLAILVAITRAGALKPAVLHGLSALLTAAALVLLGWTILP